jgi:mRNA interferase RelE/StbE
MGYKIEWDKKAYDALNKLETLVARRIVKLVKEFAENPESKEIKKLKGEKAFRLRAGDYRIILDMDLYNKKIKVLKVGHRKNIYNN